MTDYHVYNFDRNPQNPIRQYFLTVSVIIINIFIFIIFNLFLYENGYDYISFGTNSWIKITEQGEYYRLFTAMFLHADIDHLMNNMLILFVIGSRYEYVEGKLRFFILYFVGGVLASLVSMSYNIALGSNVDSLGASGAIFALVGGAIAAVAKNRNKLKTISKNQLLAFAAFSLYAGFKDIATDNAAHLGGFFAGFLLGLFLSKKTND